MPANTSTPPTGPRPGGAAWTSSGPEIRDSSSSRSSSNLPFEAASSAGSGTACVKPGSPRRIPSPAGASSPADSSSGLPRSSGPGERDHSKDGSSSASSGSAGTPTGPSCSGPSPSASTGSNGLAADSTSAGAGASSASSSGSRPGGS